MTQQEFQDGLDRWGVDFAHWPDEIRLQAQRLAVEDLACAQMLQTARHLQALFASTQDVKAPKGLADRIFKATKTDKPRDHEFRVDQPVAMQTASDQPGAVIVEIMMAPQAFFMNAAFLLLFFVMLARL